MALYTPLSSSLREIRLLRLLHLPKHTAEQDGASARPITLHCELSIHQLHEDSHSEYTALSYVWGLPASSESSSNANVIVLNGQTLPVQPNLLSALRSFWDRNDGVFIWADALCINQSDPAEKKVQIALMGDIYRLASKTIIWLGEAEGDSDLAMDAIASIQLSDMEGLEFEHRRREWEAIRAIFQRPWWSRVWVVQEAYLSKNPIARCGSKDIAFECFVMLKQHYETSYWRNQSKWQQYPLFQNVPYTSCLSNWHIAKNEIARGGSSPISWIASSTWALQCTEPRDRIYGILGLCTAEDREAIKADYSDERKLRDIIIDVVLRSHKTSGLLLLTLVGPEEQKDEALRLPSWVPDLTRVDKTLHLVSAGEQHAFRAFLDPQDPMWTRLFQNSKIPEPERALVSSFDRSREVFLIYGCLCDIITHADATPFVPENLGYDVDKALLVKAERWRATIEAFRKWEPLALDSPADIPDIYSELPGGRSEAFWRTLSCDSQIRGERPLPSNFGERFEALMGRGPNSNSDGQTVGEPMKDEWIRQYAVPAIVKCVNKSFVLTYQGRMGLAIRGAREGDIIVIARGGQVPYVVRRREDWGFTFVGEAYVHGVMDGEAVTDAVKRNLCTIKFHLR